VYGGLDFQLAGLIMAIFMFVFLESTLFFKSVADLRLEPLDDYH
jgi:hypothetical protein